MEEGSNISRRRRTALTEGSADYKLKRDEIVQAAVKLFKEKGYKSTTLSDIAKRAGLDRATVYYYVGSKEELFHEAVKGILDENVIEAERLLRVTTMGPREKLERLIERLMTSYEENYPHVYVYIQEEMFEVEGERTPWAKQMVRQTRRFESAVSTLLDQGVTQGIFRDDIPVRLAANAIFGMFNWTHRWFKPGGKQTARHVASAFCKIFFDGMQDAKQP
ncbi:bacterial regulatory s, tetR family protein [Paraburkholderia xenovorans LB400]|uniref:Transcriptional regulator, TetR family n=1 Tax=Paraburkholderia xenovorans (strain LB400) TaxID=266265 RepID=Q13I61_PARXL|nr:TetR/AcrR family transcriptional regulator [Paraburkholderia xenovorans]ABE36228.1 transcriptional regulator, TetR family [Paraburkholderia xenovorans LB400]AIP35158.1 bacterial regulatory s, tetR family protein [Paraburkholderia xenovorans LB400]